MSDVRVGNMHVFICISISLMAINTHAHTQLYLYTQTSRVHNRLLYVYFEYSL